MNNVEYFYWIMNRIEKYISKINYSTNGKSAAEIYAKFHKMPKDENFGIKCKDYLVKFNLNRYKSILDLVVDDIALYEDGNPYIPMICDLRVTYQDYIKETRNSKLNNIFE